LDLLSQAFLPTAKNGRFGNPHFSWENTKSAESLKK